MSAWAWARARARPYNASPLSRSLFGAMAGHFGGTSEEKPSSNGAGHLRAGTTLPLLESCGDAQPGLPCALTGQNHTILGAGQQGRGKRRLQQRCGWPWEVRTTGEWAIALHITSYLSVIGCMHDGAALLVSSSSRASRMGQGPPCRLGDRPAERGRGDGSHRRDLRRETAVNKGILVDPGDDLESTSTHHATSKWLGGQAGGTFPLKVQEDNETIDFHDILYISRYLIGARKVRYPPVMLPETLAFQFAAANSCFVPEVIDNIQND
ncbi:hypothetical protein B7494_g3255 [Chlorociboria aeruginascens]|nr:hypothetical protein B7494_g3255 [Chlorociboria aeruginascens]